MNENYSGQLKEPQNVVRIEENQGKTDSDTKKVKHGITIPELLLKTDFAYEKSKPI